MVANLIKIGNSRGIIIPDKLLNLIGIKEKVTINIRDGEIVIGPVDRENREGWEEMLRQETEKYGPSEILLPDVFRMRTKTSGHGEAADLGLAALICVDLRENLRRSAGKS